MPITALPALDRTSVNFKANVDTFFGSQLPTFSTEAEAARVEINNNTASASTSAATATTKAGEALTSANNAATSKTGADTARDAAVVARTAAEAALDSFDDRYLGAKATAPTLDNDGNALLTGALYWDTSLPGMRSWNGTAWVTLPAATAAAIANTPAAGVTELEVQGAINGLETRKVALTVVLADSIDLNTVVTSGFYRLANTPVNAPAGAAFSQLIVSRGGDTITQIVSSYTNNKLYVRAGNPINVGGAGSWSAWREVYTAGSILGTVSQSAGVPTGAVIERGSNANGSYIRFADGTQICTHILPTFAVGANALVEAAWNFPAAFLSAPNLPAWTHSPSLSGDVYGYVYLTTSSATNGSLVFRNGVTAQNVQATNATAIGRWF